MHLRVAHCPQLVHAELFVLVEYNQHLPPAQVSSTITYLASCLQRLLVDVGPIFHIGRGDDLEHIWNRGIEIPICIFSFCHTVPLKLHGRA